MKLLCTLLLLTCSSGFAQVTIKNSDGVEVPVEKVNVIFRMVSQVVAETFHVSGEDIKEFPLVLVLGSPIEHYTQDEEHHVYIVYLNRWNEAQFAASAMRLTIQAMLVPRGRRDKMVIEILRRSNQVAPVSVRTLANEPK